MCISAGIPTINGRIFARPILRPTHLLADAGQDIGILATLRCCLKLVSF